MEFKQTHISEALGNLIEEYKNAKNLKVIVTSYVTQIQILEDVFQDITIARSVNDAENAQLDGLGTIVGEPRQGRNDLDYRQAVRVRIDLNLSSGTIEQMISVIQSTLNVSEVIITEYFPAAFLANVIDPIDPNNVSDYALELIKSGKAAGVGFDIIVSPQDPFQYDIGLGYDVGHYATVV